MEEYKLTKSQLEILSKKIYEEACYGYLDLKDSVCERIISEFLDDKKLVDTPVEAVLAEIASNGSRGGAAGWSMTSSGSYVPINWSGVGTHYVGTSIGAGTSYTYTVNGSTNSSGEIVLDSNDVVLRDNVIDLRSTGF